MAYSAEERKKKVKQAERVVRELQNGYQDREATIALGVVGTELQCDGPEHVNK